MTARGELVQRLHKHGWMLLKEQGRRTVVYFRWLPGTCREELSIIFDPLDRVEAWSIWHNQRLTSPDQDAGRRARLIEYIESR